MTAAGTVAEALQARFGAELSPESARDGVPTFRVSAERAHDVLRHLKSEVPQPYRMLWDLTAIDERVRRNHNGEPAGDYTVVYHLLSFDRNDFVRIQAPLTGEHPSLPTVTDLWANANWYEREVWDMFGVRFDGHPHLVRILMPKTWVGHPLRKDHPARATEMGPFHFTQEMEEREQEALRFHPEEWGMKRSSGDTDFMFLNVGPQHPGTHGILRIVLQLDGETIVDAVPEIGFHHRAAEKMGERQTWHTYIPYTDRVDYLSGVLNNLAYLMGVEKLGNIHVPPRAVVIRVMLCELYRIMSHLVWYGTFAQDLGQMSPVFYTFNDRERAMEIAEAVTGARMHPGWFRIGGVAADLPDGWEKLFRNFVAYLPKRLKEYEREVLQNRIFKARTVGVGAYTTGEAIEWGITGPNLRACGLDWDLRKRRPYSGYDQFEFDIPVGSRGDCYDRAVVRAAEIRQSLRIIEQCIDNMPEGPYKSDHPLATPPNKNNTMHDIETLITHFLNVSWGPPMPPGAALGVIESSKGTYGYYLVSDGNTYSYRTRIRAPSFPALQMLPMLCRGGMVADLLAILGAMDFVLADVDR